MLEHVWPSGTVQDSRSPANMFVSLSKILSLNWCVNLSDIRQQQEYCPLSTVQRYGYALDIVRQLTYSGDTGNKCSKCFDQYCHGNVLNKNESFSSFLLNSLFIFKGRESTSVLCLIFASCFVFLYVYVCMMQFSPWGGMLC